VWYVEFRVTDILIQSVSPDNWRLSSLLTHSFRRTFFAETGTDFRVARYGNLKEKQNL